MSCRLTAPPPTSPPSSCSLVSKISLQFLALPTVHFSRLLLWAFFLRTLLRPLWEHLKLLQAIILSMFPGCRWTQSSSTPYLPEARTQNRTSSLPLFSSERTYAPDLFAHHIGAPESFISLHHTWIRRPNEKGTENRSRGGALPGVMLCRSYSTLELFKTYSEQLIHAPLIDLIPE